MSRKVQPLPGQKNNKKPQLDGGEIIGRKEQTKPGFSSSEIYKLRFLRKISGINDGTSPN